VENKWLILYLSSYLVTEILGMLLKRSNLETDKKLKFVALLYYTGGAIGTYCLLL
jgi:hypothetical protein